MGVRWKFLFVISALLILFGLTLTVTNIREDEAVLRRRLEEKASSMITFLAESAVNPMAILDVYQLRLLVRTTTTQPEVVYAFAFSTNGRILTDGTEENPYRHKVLDDPISKAAVKAERVLIQTSGNVLDVSREVSLGGRRLGGVRIGFSLMQLESQLRAMRNQNLLFGLGFVLLGVVLTWGLTESITRPVDLLIRGTRAVAEDAFDTRIDVRTNDEMQVLASAFNQMTERLQQTREKLIHDAIHDALTGLPNRTLFLDRLHQALNRTERNGRSVAVLFLDVDGFKLINDSLGHGTGDAFLQALAGRLRTASRPADTVARLGGDEFAVLIEDLSSPRDAVLVAERLLADLDSPFRLSGHELFATASIGIALSSGTQSDQAALLRDADTAMYRVKIRGKAGYEVFDEAMHQEVRRALTIQNELRNAASRGELSLVYQPIVRLASGDLVGFEALLRWKHPQLGTVPPLEFIPVAESTGAITSIGEWVLREACRQAARWRTEVDPPVAPMISVNLSRRQFTNPDLAAQIARILAETGVPPNTLTVEITEGTMMEQTDLVAFLLGQLNDMQVRVALDDFGTGYSSLSLLPRFPIHTLKIDRSFLQDLRSPSGNLGIVQAIITLAHTSGMVAVAEGIETDSEASLLRGMQCDYGQGDLFSRPLSPDDATAHLRRIGSGLISPPPREETASSKRR
jgi:diguanylate cyclase (GGDEF)-like protein